jgi:flagellar biosynthesis/type III secretory pathway chaperone
MKDGIDKLIDEMQGELERHNDLAALLERKIDAMKRFDTGQMETLTAQEQGLVHELQVKGRQREAAVTLASRQLLGARGAGRLTAKELAVKSPEPQRTRLLALSGMLREVGLKVQSLNRVNALASHKVLGQFDQVFQILARSGREIGLYGRGGRTGAVEQNRLVDTIA